MQYKQPRTLLARKRMLQSLLPLRDWTSTANTAHWLYLMGGVLYIFLLVLLPFWLFVTIRYSDLPTLFFVLLGAIAACCITAFVWELSKIIHAFWKHSVGKWALRLLIAAASVAATCLARYLINFITIGLDPSSFPRATAVIAIPSAIVIWWIVALFLSLPLFTVSVVLPELLIAWDKREIIHRFIGNSFICRFSSGSQEYITVHEGGLRQNMSTALFSCVIRALSLGGLSEL